MYCTLLKCLVFSVFIALSSTCENGLKAFITEYQDLGCIDTSVNVLCRGSIVRVDNAQNYYCSDCGVLRKNQGCCGDEVYDKTTDICCGGDVVDGNIYGCCLGEKVEKSETDLWPCPGDQMCSGTSHGDNCCGNEHDSPDFACCDGRVYNTTTHMCCGNLVVSSSNHLCCHDTPVRKINPEAHMECCGRQAYDPQKYYRCERSLLVPIDAPALCGESFLLDDQQCCHENMQPLYDKKTQEKRFCCGVDSYVKSTNSCSVSLGVVVPKTTRPEKPCDNELYGPTNKLCCSGQLYDQYDTTGEAMNCCGLYAMNVRTHLCTFGRPYPRSSVAEEPDCPIKSNNVTGLLASPFVALKTFKDMMKKKFAVRNCTISGSERRCNRQKLRLKVGERCIQFFEALQSGEFVIIAGMAESSDKLVLTKRLVWGFSSRRRLRNVFRHARKS